MRVRVLDRGPGLGGLAPADLFTPFYRAPATAAIAGGAGIGLHVCQRLIEAMGGRIWARARPGGGSEFGFWLPAYDMEPDDHAHDRAFATPTATLIVVPADPFGGVVCHAEPSRTRSQARPNRPSTGAHPLPRHTEGRMSTQPLVLVADDEPRITKLVSIALGEEGFRVITAAVGRRRCGRRRSIDRTWCSWTS